MVDINIDLSPLLLKPNVAIDTDPLGSWANNNMTFVLIKLPDDLRSTDPTGTINLWKIDALFTTKEIQ